MRTTWPTFTALGNLGAVRDIVADRPRSARWLSCRSSARPPAVNECDPSVGGVSPAGCGDVVQAFFSHKKQFPLPDVSSHTC
eukprot:5158673-Prymnesium_polylepis.1